MDNSTAIHQVDHIFATRKPEWYHDKIILAPMVRVCSLPFRLLCLQYGADLVYTEELIDYRLSECRRLENRVLGTIDFVDTRGEVIFRTSHMEKARLVLQLGSNNPDRALKAAKLVSHDVSGIDFNFGCPKPFSISGGMGAALLEKPEQIQALLTKCIKNLNIPVTCKIRVLPSLDKTLELVKLIESCGVSAIAVHGRTKVQRSRDENLDSYIEEIVKRVEVPVIANGGSNHIKSHPDILKFKAKTQASSVMVARAAMRNPSLFKRDGDISSIDTVMKEFLKLAVKYENSTSNTKYTLQYMLGAHHAEDSFIRDFHSAFDYKSLCNLFGLGEWYNDNLPPTGTDQAYDEFKNDEFELSIDENLKLLKLNESNLVSDTIPYKQKLYGCLSPKAQLMNLVNKESHPLKPQFHVIEFKRHRYYCIIEYKDRIYLNRSFTNSKRNSEQASSLLVCGQLGLVDLTEYKSKTSGANRYTN